MSTAINAPQKVLDLLDRLHELSLDQEAKIKDSHGDHQAVLDSAKTLDPATKNKIRDEAMKNAFIALDMDKAHFMYNLVRAIGAVNVIEAGTSYGVSTIYLALAVGQNAMDAGKRPDEAKVIATEHWHEKAEQARKHWSEAGDSVEPWIELREGDITKTLQTNMPSIDFVLFDSEFRFFYESEDADRTVVWTPLVVPTLDVIESKLSPGAVLLCDNVCASVDGYADFFARIKAPGSNYKTVTLPFEGGLEMVTYWP